jgi:protein-disulfide isomerase
MSSTTRQRKSEREAQRKRQQQIYLLVGIIVVAVLVLVAIVIATQSATDTGSLAENAADGTGPYANVEMSYSGEGLPQLGSDDAPLTIYEYSSFGCSHCANFHENQFQELLPEIAAGNVRFVMSPVSNSFSLPATEAAFCADDQGKYWEMHDALFGFLFQFGNAAFIDTRLTSAAEDLGLDVNEFSACLSSTRTQQRVDAANQLFYSLADQYPNVTGTPTLTFNGTPPEWGSGGPDMAYIREQITNASGS